MTEAECVKANAEVKLILEAKHKENTGPTAAPQGWKGYQVYLLTDGRQTISLPFTNEDGTPDPFFVDGMDITTRFACPFCNEYTLKLDAFQPDTTDNGAAQCDNCACALMTDTPYKDWQNCQPARMWW